MNITNARVFAAAEDDDDRAKELKDFDDTKAGVKGLVDAGVVKIPRIFIKPQDELGKDEKSVSNGTQFNVPVVDLIGIDKGDRKGIIDKIRSASENWGFFQLVNHGVPVSVIEEMIQGIRSFHEQDDEVKKEFYTRDHMKRVRYISNFDLYRSRAANWRDTLHFTVLTPDLINPEELPEACRESTMEYTKHVIRLGDTLLGLLSEALGLKPSHLKDMGCAKGLILGAHYYPACPEPELTNGVVEHTDPSFLTVLLQDNIGGLQVLHQHHWVDVHPVPGALVVNIGDLIQMISNDKFKSVKHKVVANRVGPRISVGTFFSTNFEVSMKPCGPIKELISKDNPPIYKEILMTEFMEYYIFKGLDDVPPLTHFKL